MMPALSSAVTNAAKLPIATTSPVTAFMMAGIFCHSVFFLFVLLIIASSFLVGISWLRIVFV
jgi:hypothetical protein